MKEVTVEELKAKFVVASVAPYGEVVMVPGGDFDPDWEAMLEEEGFGCVFTEINGEKFVLVKLEKEEDEETAAEPSHVPKRGDSGKSARRSGVLPGHKTILWSDADEERLLKRVGELPGTIEEKVAQLVSEFSGRTATGLHKKYQKLKRRMKKKAKAREGQDEKRLQDANKEQVLADASIPMEHVSAETVAAATTSNWAALDSAGGEGGP